MDTKKKVLLLEEDSQLTAALLPTLQDAGWTTVSAGSAEEALEILYSAECDLLVIDLAQPNPHAEDPQAIIRARLPADTAALIITGNRREENACHFPPQDNIDFLSKPFAADEVVRRLEVLRFRLKQRDLTKCREQRLCRLAHWYLNSMLNCGHPALNADARRHIKSACGLARFWGERMGILPPEREELEAATALLGLIKYTGMDTQTVLQDESCPEYIRRLFADSQSLPAVIADLSLTGLTNQEVPPQYPETQRLFLEQSLAAALPDMTSQDVRNSCCRSCLNLGLLLLQAGDWAHADQAFRLVCSQGNVQEQIAALLSLASAARVCRHYAAVGDYVQKAASLAQGLGPAPHARTLLKGAICLMRAGCSEALSYSESSLKLLRTLKLEPELSLATLALASQKDLPDDEILSALQVWEASCSPASADQDGAWIVPCLIRRHVGNRSSPYYSHLLRLARCCPEPFRELLCDSSRPLQQRLCCAQLLQCRIPAFTCPNPGVLHANDRGPLVSQVSEKLDYKYIPYPAQPLLQVSSLGIVRIAAGSRTLQARDWPTSKTRNLLLMLLCFPDGLSEDTIIEEFWPDNWDKGKQNLYSTTSSLRRVLKKLLPEHSGIIQRRSGQLKWNNDLPVWFDLLEVRRLACRIHSADSLTAWQGILNLIQGPFLPDCQQNWAEIIRAEIAALQREGLHWLSSFYHYRRQSAESLDYAQRLLALDSTDQPACELALQAHLQLGQTEKAVRLYQTFCANLRSVSIFSVLPPLQQI